MNKASMTEQVRFAEGQLVEWTSQSAGYTKVKAGAVAQVVPARSMPSRDRFPALYKGAGVGSYRDHESYVVLVGTRAYWPRVNGLSSRTP